MGHNESVAYVGDKRLRLVLADDARHLLEMEKTFFPESEFEVALAHNGCEAYNLVKSNEPDVVFLDLFMPLLNGEECCRLIKSDLRLRHTRVVLVAPDAERELQRCHAAQCDLVVTKPIRRRSFIGAVQTLMGQLHRVPARWPVRIAVELHVDGRCCLQGWTVNLSERGVYLESGEMLPMEKPYLVRLKPSGQAELSLPARIAWLNPAEAPRDRRLPPGFGLQFLETRGEPLAQLRRLLGTPTLPAAPGEGARMFVELPMLAGKRL